MKSVKRRRALPSRLSALASMALPWEWLHAAEGQGLPPPAASGANILQMLLGLGLVLVMVAAGAWIMKRLQLNQGSAGSAIKVLAGAAVGPRERVVLIEVGGTWIVLGVAPGRVNALSTLPRGELPVAARRPQAAEQGFAFWLKRMTERRDAR